MTLESSFSFANLPSMGTAEDRAYLLAEHCEKMKSEYFLGNFTAQDLLDWIKLELGNTAILDQFVKYGTSSSSTMALPNGPILHILSGNTPHAGLQSLLRGLLIGADNLVKLPSRGLPDVSDWIKTLPIELSNLIEIINHLDDQIFSSARTVIAIGSDLTMTEIQPRISQHQRFIPHGHKLSIGLVKTPSIEAAKRTIQDACTFNQQGCLSLHTVYVMENARDFLPMIAEAMHEYELSHPRGEISISESGAISNLRETIRYEAANDIENVAIAQSEDNTSWTAIYRNSPTLTPSVLNRFISVQPWPDHFENIGPERLFISTIAVEKSTLNEVSSEDVPRICALGASQKPNLTWHHDGFPPLASLVRWRDIDIC